MHASAGLALWTTCGSARCAPAPSTICWRPQRLPVPRDGATQAANTTSSQPGQPVACLVCGAGSSPVAGRPKPSRHKASLRLARNRAPACQPAATCGWRVGAIEQDPSIRIRNLTHKRPGITITTVTAGGDELDRKSQTMPHDEFDRAVRSHRFAGPSSHPPGYVRTTDNVLPPRLGIIHRFGSVCRFCGQALGLKSHEAVALELHPPGLHPSGADLDPNPPIAVWATHDVEPVLRVRATEPVVTRARHSHALARTQPLRPDQDDRSKTLGRQRRPPPSSSSSPRQTACPV